MSFGSRLRTVHRGRVVIAMAVAVLIVWELAAAYVAGHSARPDNVLPSIQHALGAFDSLSDYWHGGLGVRATQDGGPQTFGGALLALGDGVRVTGLRLLGGMALALVLGVGIGLAIGYVKAIRRFAFAPLNFLGVLPMLAILPLFAFWFGATTRAAVLFIGFGAGITIMRATLNAVENVPSVYVQAAKTLGAGRLRIYRTVIIPAIGPELRGGVAIALTFSWSLALGAELIDVQDGLGRMMVLSLRFAAVDRMVLIAGVFVALAVTTVLAFNRLADRLTRWAE